MHKTIAELAVGDIVLHRDGTVAYTVVEIVRDEPSEKIALVQWVDGGRDMRAWGPEHFEQDVLVSA